jgi:PKD repeat protein
MNIAKQLLVIIILAMALSGGISGCGASGGGGGPAAPQEPNISPPTVSASYENGNVVVTWVPVPNAKAYNVYWATSDLPREMSTKVETVASSYVLSPVTAGANYYVAVAAIGPSGMEGAASEKVKITIPGPNRSPVASFASPRSVQMAAPATFDASASSDEDGSIFGYTFDFGDGSQLLTQNSPFASHTYSSRGTYLVTLTVTDDKGAVGSAAKEISVGFDDDGIVNVSRTQDSYSQAPVGAVDASGNPAALWYEDGSIYFARSRDEGINFIAEMQLVPQGMFYFDQPAIAASENDFFFSLTVFPFSGGAEILFTRSKDGGLLSDPKIVSTIDVFNSYISSIAASYNDVVITWTDGYAGPPGGIMLTRSLDAGDTFTAPVNVAVGGYCSDVALHNGRSYLAWIDGYSGEIFFAASDEGGTIFSTPIQISTSAEKVWCPDLKVDAVGTVLLMWPQGSAFEIRSIMMSRSVDGGISFTAPKMISSGGDAPCAALALDPAGVLYTTWSEPNGGAMKTYLAYSRDRGETFSPPMRLLQMGESGCPSITSGVANTLDIFWTGPPEESPKKGGFLYPEIYFSKVRIAR